MKKKIKSKKSDETIEFLQILQQHYHKMLNASRRIDIWDDVLQDCQQNGILLNRDSRFLYRTRWPALTRAAAMKWKNKKSLSKKDEFVIEICRITNPGFCKEVVKEVPKIEESVFNDHNKEYCYSGDEDDGDSGVGGDFDSLDEPRDDDQNDIIKDVVENMIDIVSDCQDAIDSLIEKCDDISASSSSDQGIHIPASVNIDEQQNARFSNPLFGVPPPSTSIYPPLNSPFIYRCFPHFSPSGITTYSPPPSPFIYSRDIEKAQIAALQAYTINCQWATYKFQLEVEALKKFSSSSHV
uniref:Uncharacterized protein n=1 Tax=Panagrolaimus superbus TaxID=310955 RepID=A0A914YM16_9BILA